jgi:hypothetical protein
MPEINYTCSLGSLCHSSQILKRNKCKLYSYPFDWIFSNCNNIIHCIKDNFNIFLNKSYYIDRLPQQCGHSNYHKCMFNHHNPLINIDHYNYYVRCVDRFNNLLQAHEHTLFIMIFINMNDIYENKKNEVIEFNNEFSKYTSNYTLLVIFNIPDKEQIRHIFEYNDNIHFLELHTLSRSNGREFDNNDDNIYLDNIINSNYTFNLKDTLNIAYD